MSIEAGLKYFDSVPGTALEFSLETVHPLLLEGVDVARRLLPLAPQEAKYLEDTVKGRIDKTTLSRINAAVSEAKTKVDEKLETVAMSVPDYFSAYSAFHKPGGDVLVNQMVEATERKLNLSSVVSTLATQTEEEVGKKHAGIINKILSRVRSTRPKDQRLVIVSGPFAAGKSETVHSRFDLGNVLEIDLDILRGMLMEGYDQSSQEDIQRVRGESWVLSDLLLRRALESGRSVLIQSALHRDRWLTDANLNFAQSKGIGMDIYMVLRPVSDCLVRNVKRSGRTVSFKDLTQSIGGMKMLPKIIEKYDNTQKVVLLDYYPLVQEGTGMICEFGNEDYVNLLDYAKRKQNNWHVQRQSVDIHIESQ